MNVEDYYAACSLVLESFEAHGMSVARRDAADFTMVEFVDAHMLRFILETGRRLRDEFLRQHGWTVDDAGCWAEPGSTGSNKYRWAANRAETEQRRRSKSHHERRVFSETGEHSP